MSALQLEDLKLLLAHSQGRDAQRAFPLPSDTGIPLQPSRLLKGLGQGSCCLLQLAGAGEQWRQASSGQTEGGLGPLAVARDLHALIWLMQARPMAY